MDRVLFGKMDKVFSLKKQNIKKNTGKMEKILEKSGILFVRKSGNRGYSLKNSFSHVFINKTCFTFHSLIET